MESRRALFAFERCALRALPSALHSNTVNLNTYLVHLVKHLLLSVQRMPALVYHRCHLRRGLVSLIVVCLAAATVRSGGRRGVRLARVAPLDARSARAPAGARARALDRIPTSRHPSTRTRGTRSRSTPSRR